MQRSMVPLPHLGEGDGFAGLIGKNPGEPALAADIAPGMVPAGPVSSVPLETTSRRRNHFCIAVHSAIWGPAGGSGSSGGRGADLACSSSLRCASIFAVT